MLSRILIVLALCVPALSHADTKKLDAPLARPELKRDDFTGIYYLRGEENEQEYTGVVILVKVGADLYMTHMIASGQHTKGFGVQKGNHLSLSWRPIGDPSKDVSKIMGNTLYEISEDGKTFKGTWIATGNAKTSQETLTFLRRLEDPPAPAQAEPELIPPPKE